MASSPEKSSQNENSATTTNTVHTLSAAPPNSSIFQNLAPITLKLDRANYPFWRSQVTPALRAHNLEDYVLGNTPCPSQFANVASGSESSRQVNPDYNIWVRMDQAIISWLLNFISESMFGHIVRCNTSREV